MTVATKEGLSKSGMIRAVLKENPKATPVEVIAAVKEQFGQDVTPALVGNIKYRKKGKTKSTSGGGTRSVVKHVDLRLSLDAQLSDLRAAVDFAKTIGGVARARDLFNILAEGWVA